jgi:hypothetical protein
MRRPIRLELDARQHCASCQKTTSEQVLSHTSFFGGVPRGENVFLEDRFLLFSWLALAAG